MRTRADCCGEAPVPKSLWFRADVTIRVSRRHVSRSPLVDFDSRRLHTVRPAARRAEPFLGPRSSGADPDFTYGVCIRTLSPARVAAKALQLRGSGWPGRFDCSWTSTAPGTLVAWSPSGGASKRSQQRHRRPLASSRGRYPIDLVPVGVARRGARASRLSGLLLVAVASPRSSTSAATKRGRARAFDRSWREAAGSASPR